MWTHCEREGRGRPGGGQRYDRLDILVVHLCGSFVRGAMRSLFASTELGCRAIATEVLGYRSWLSAEELSALAEDEDPRILSLALPALAAARHPALGRALVRALLHADLRLQAAALDAMALAAHPQAASAARTAAEGALGDRALVRLALVAGEHDARWLMERMQSAPTPEAIEAAGWRGSWTRLQCCCVCSSQAKTR